MKYRMAAVLSAVLTGFASHSMAMDEESARNLVTANSDKIFECDESQANSEFEGGVMEATTFVAYSLTNDDLDFTAYTRTILNIGGTRYEAQSEYSGYAGFEDGEVYLQLPNPSVLRQDPLPRQMQWTTSQGSLHMFDDGDGPELRGTMTDSAGHDLELECRRKD